MSTKELSEALQSGKISPSKVLAAFATTSVNSNKETNFITEYVDGSFERASKLDKVSGRGRGILHGMPCSIKECLGFEGEDANIGCSRWVDVVCPEDAAVVKVLRDAGAVPLCRTNLPQGMLSFECSNPVYGTTTNPWDTKRTCGGSSGGDGAAVASNSVAFGIGTDIGGSVRIPSSFCGIVGLKPTSDRISFKGARGAVPGQSGISRSIGPLCKDVDGCALVMQALCSEDMWRLDPYASPIPFNLSELRSTKPLRIGWYTDDGWLPPTPGPRRAVQEAVRALQQKTLHTLVEFKPPCGARGAKLFFNLISADRGATMSRKQMQEFVDPTLKPIVKLAGMPALLRSVLVRILKLIGSPKTAFVMNSAYGLDVEALWSRTADRDKYRDEWFQAMRDQEVDVLLCPAHVLPAPPVGHAGFLAPSVLYTAMFNLLGWPAGVVPNGTVSEQDERDLDSWWPSRDMLRKKCVAAAKGAVGMPLSVQVVGLPNEDERVLRVMKDVEDSLQ